MRNEIIKMAKALDMKVETLLACQHEHGPLQVILNGELTNRRSKSSFESVLYAIEDYVTMKQGMKKMDRLDKKIVAANVKRFIQANGYSKQSFAKKLSMPRLALDQLLAVEMQTEQLHKYVQKMATVFQCTPAYLLNPLPQHTEIVSFSNQLQQLKEKNPQNEQLLSDLEDVLDIAALYL